MCRTSRELGAVESCRRLVRRQSWSLQLDDRRSDEPVDLERGELRSEEHTSELQSQSNIVCRLLLEKKNVFSRPPIFTGRWQLSSFLRARTMLRSVPAPVPAVILHSLYQPPGSYWPESTFRYTFFVP